MKSRTPVFEAIEIDVNIEGLKRLGTRGVQTNSGLTELRLDEFEELEPRNAAQLLVLGTSVTSKESW